jgi:AraC-like DNA-binding protein
MYLLFCFGDFIIYAFLYQSISETTYFAFVSMHIFFIGIMGLRQQEIFTDKISNTIKTTGWKKTISDKKRPRADIAEVSEVKSKSTPPVSSIKKKKPDLLNDEQKQIISNKIIDLMSNKKLFLNSELSLNDLAEELGMHKNYVSFTINEVFKVNFYQLINQYRIEEAKRLLSDVKYNNYSIEGIAKTCGFKTRNVFYPIFKKLTGITPKEYQEQIQKEKKDTDTNINTQ